MSMSDAEIKRFLTIQSHERFARLFIENCTSKILVSAEDEVYIFNNEFKYYQMGSSSSLMMNLISKVLHEITDKWQIKFEQEMKNAINNSDMDSDDKKQKIKRISETIQQTNTAIKNIETTTFIKNIITQVITILMLSEDKIVGLNTLPNYLNFRNGKLNLKTLEFSDRTPDDFITEYLEYDYAPNVNKNIQEKIKIVLKQICNNRDEDYNFIMSHLGYCITSETKEQKYLNAYGASASNGKSTIIKIMEAVFNIYVFKADKRLFSESFGKSHKYFTGMKNKRIVYIEEVDKKKTDGELLKDIVDGNKMNNEVLFGTTEKIDIFFKLLFFSNNIMNLDADSGIKRRMIAMEFNSIFTDQEDFAEKKATYPNSDVFLIDRNLLSLFKTNIEYKIAFMHLVIAEANAYFNTGLIIPESYKEATNDLCDENDKMKHFIDNHFVITKDDKDRITKDEFTELFNTQTKCNFAWTSILSDIKRVGLTYDGGKRALYKGATIRGVVVGIKKKVLDPFIETSDLDIQDSKDAEIKALKKQIEELKKLIPVRNPLNFVDNFTDTEEEVIFKAVNPYEMIIRQCEQDRLDMIEITRPKPKKPKKINKKRFELFLNDIDDLC